MYKNLLIYIFLLFLVNETFATTTFTVGSSGATHSTILAAYNDCTGSDNYIIEIKSNYDYGTSSDSSGITLSLLTNKNSTNTVTIRPETGVTLSFLSAATTMFTLQGANWVIFDGRAGGVGSSAWTMINSSSAVSQRVFVFKDNGSNNIIRYCTIKGDNSSVSATSGGLISFYTSTASTGNNNNTIDNCTLRENSTLPKIIIVSNGSTTTKRNKNNTISNCHLINYDYAAIQIGTNSEAYTISDNHFYQTATYVPSGSTLKTILFSGGYGDHTVTGNFIGGQGASCSGGAYTLSGSFAFYGVWIVTSSGTSTISNNTIANLNLTSSAGANGVIPIFCGIYTGSSGSFVIGSSGNGNTIGSTTGAGNIVLNYSGSASNAPVFSGIHLASEGSHSVSNNTIGGIDYSSSVTNGTDQFALLRIFSNTTVSIDSNTFGNTTANNISINSNTGFLAGIYSDLVYTPTLTISNNTFQNFTVNDVSGGTDARIYGIKMEDQLLPTSIYNNVIKTFTNKTLSPSISDLWSSSVTGITLSHTNTPSGNISVYDNRISDLISTYTGSNMSYTTGLIVGTANTGTLSVYRNKIKGLSNASTNASSGIIGLYLANGSTDSATVYNNIISISDGSNTDAKIIRGIVDEFSSGISNIYHNTVKIYSNYSTGTAISSALYLVPNTANYRVKNNIFQNVSTGNGTHYAQNWTTTYATPSNIQNNYNEAPIVANWGGTDKTTNDDWKTAISSSSEVTGSITISSSFGNPSSNDVVGSAGTPITSVTTDYDLNPRSALNPWIGAFELITPLSFNLEKMNAKCQKSKNSNSEYGGTVTWTTLNETNNDYYTIQKSMDGFVWEVVDTIDGAGTNYQPTNYYYHDNFVNPTPENEIVVYYRVSQTNFDGVVNEIGILSCKCEASDKIKIHPVPSTDFIVINFGDQNNVPNTFQITDMFGRIIEDITVSGNKAINTSYTLDISKYASGRYLIKINDWKMKEDAVFIKE